MSRRRVIVLAGILLVAIAAVLVWRSFPRDDVTRATVGQAVRDFRDDERPGQASGAGLPGGIEPGVYRYRIQGGESVDAVIGSAGHSYGGISTIAITSSPCGLEEKWQILVTRWTESELCGTGEELRLARLRDSHEFFGQVNLLSYECRGDEIPSMRDQAAGMRWTILCTAENAAVESRTAVVGVESIEIAGEPVEAVHTRSSIELRGEVSGGDSREEWRRRSDGLLLRRTVDVDATIDVIGSADYNERYSLTLLSLEPQR